MAKIIKVFFLLTAAFLFPAAVLADEGGELLWWMVGDVGSISGKDKDGNVHSASELGVQKARVRYDNGSGESGYLTLWSLDENNDFVQDTTMAEPRVVSPAPQAVRATSIRAIRTAAVIFFIVWYSFGV